jgi:asparagine synthase (glutamine-hydrolysing)
MVLKRMTDVLIHRGPDDEGFFTDAAVGLGFRRLSIIDVAGGHQPILNEDGSCAIVFNGEIYNYLELKPALLSKGHTFKTNTDTEVILHLYEEKGPDCVKDLRGMFALAIWDGKKQQLFLARDRLGIKPLYYSIDHGRCLFGSEIKAIVQHPALEKRIDLEALSDYLSFLYIPAPKTIFKGVRKLPAGHYAVIDRNKIEERQYWDVRFDPVRDKSEKSLVEELYQLLSESVRLRLMSEVPLGAFLSGGVDSGSIVGLMSEITQRPVITNSIGFYEEEYNELKYAREIAALFKAQHHEYIVEPKAMQALETLAWHYDEPFADASAIPTYYVSKLARENVTVALTGDGGDENFAGYRRYFYDRLENRLRSRIPDFARKFVIGSIAQVYPKADWAPQALRGKTLLTNLSSSPEWGYYNSMTHFKDRDKHGLFRDRVLKDYSSFSVFEKYFDRADTGDPLSRAQYVDMKTYLVDDILTKVDRASMAVSLEARVPLLDHKLVEFVATIPSSLKLNGTSGKYIFKKAMERLLPPETVHRKKMGFNVPVGLWFRNEIRDFASKILLDAHSGIDAYFNSDLIRKMWNQHQSGVRDNATKLWVLLIFEMWYRRFMIDGGRV